MITQRIDAVKLTVLPFCFNKTDVGAAMELKYLHTVKKIIETGSYQDAAVLLNYAPSTISFQIKQLEQELQTQLFEKKNGRMVLTQAGRELLPLMNQVLDSVDRLLSWPAGQDALRGTLTIALPESLLTYALQPVLKVFKEQAPETKLSLRVMNCFSIREQLLSSEIDLAIHYDVGPYSSSVHTMPLQSYSLVLVGSPTLSWEERDFVTPNQHKCLSHIQNDKDALYLKILNRYLRDKNITLEGLLEVWSIESIKRSVMSGLGVAYLPRFTVEEELRTDQLAALATEIPNGEMTAICVYDRGKWVSPVMKLFLELLIKHFPQGQI